jgi:hypothetical protein
MAHPNLRKKTAGDAGPTSRALVFARDELVISFIEDELVEDSVTIQISRSASQVVAALKEDPPPHPQILIADFDALDAAEALILHAIREAWYGSLIAIGEVAPDLIKSLNVERVLARPLVTNMVRDAVRALGLNRATTRIPTFNS